MRQYEFDDDEPYVIIEKHEGNMGSFLLGLALGAGAALLLAPRTGEETRRVLQQRARRARHAAEGLAEEVKDTVSDTFQQARQEVEDRLESARSAIELKKQQVTRAMEAGRAAAVDARAELERRIAETKAAYEGRGPARSRAAAASTGTGLPDEEPES